MKTFREIVNDYGREALISLLAGMAISIGCIAFMVSGNKIIGSLFFAVGLFTILSFEMSLFTGKVCYAWDKKPEFIGRLAWIWLWNVLGAWLMGVIVSATRLVNLQEIVQSIVATKMTDGYLSLFFLGILCNIMIWIAVVGWKESKSGILKLAALVFGVSVFVLCGFEHSIADAFYFGFAGEWNWTMILKLLTITAGNAVGGLAISGAMKLKNWKEKRNAQN